MKKTMLLLAFTLIGLAGWSATTWGRQTPATPEAGMALIPAGDFWMGRTHYFDGDEGEMGREVRDDTPAHKVYVDAFYMDKYELTNEEYARFVAAGAAVKRPWYWPGGKVAKGEERFPVHDINWVEATAYCQSVGKRLPTEAEWERAARGDLDRKKYPWGDEGGPDKAHSGYPWGTAEVGKFAPNTFGLYDMIGNVWEWTNDWYDVYYYTVTPDRNPPGPASGNYRVMRGGGWSDGLTMIHARSYFDPNSRAFTVGFRCAKSAASR